MADDNSAPAQAKTPDRSVCKEFLRSLVFLGVVLLALVGLMQIQPY